MFEDKNYIKSVAGSIAGQVKKELTDKLNATKGDLTKKIQDLETQFDFEENSDENFYLGCFGISYTKRTFKDEFRDIKVRLDRQEKYQRMLFAYLGLEYAELTEKTESRTTQKEVLRKTKKTQEPKHRLFKKSK